MKNITVPNGALPVGTIVAAKYETCETLYWKFYTITGYTAKRVSYKITDSGVMCFSPEQFYRVRGAWNGKPLETYNYH